MRDRGRPDHGDSPDDPDDELLLDADFPLGDGVADVAGTIWCPYCGEPNEVALDPGGGPLQEYVEDCQVCCQPWRVVVRFRADGSAELQAGRADGGDEW